MMAQLEDGEGDMDLETATATLQMLEGEAESKKSKKKKIKKEKLPAPFQPDQAPLTAADILKDLDINELDPGMLLQQYSSTFSGLSVAFLAQLVSASVS